MPVTASLAAIFSGNTNPKPNKLGQSSPNNPNKPLGNTLKTSDLFIDAKNKPGIIEAYNHHQSQNETELREYLTRPLPVKKKKPKITLGVVEIACRNAFQGLSPSEQNQLLKNCIFFSEHVGKMFKFPFSKSEESGQSSNLPAFNVLGLEEASVSQNEALTKAKEEGKASVITVDWLFKGKGKTSGLTKTKNIVNLLCQIHDIPPSVPVLQIDSTLQGYENCQLMGVLFNPSYVKDVKVPTGFPSMIMGFSEFMVWDRVLDRLQIKNLADAEKNDFKTKLAQAVKEFKQIKGDTPFTNEIVFQFKRTLARLSFSDLNIDHIFMEYVRGAIEPVFTGRPRKITDIDKNGAAITPALPNKIRVRVSLQGNSFIDNLEIKLSGLVPYLYALFSHSIHDDLYLVSLELP